MTKYVILLKNDFVVIKDKIIHFCFGCYYSTEIFPPELKNICKKNKKDKER